MDQYTINHNVEKFIIFLNILYLLLLRDKHEGYLSIKDGDDRQNKFANKLNVDKDIKLMEKSYFQVAYDYFLLQQKKFVITLKSNYFQ